MTSSFNLSFNKKSTISYSKLVKIKKKLPFIGTAHLNISSNVVIFPILTNLPNLVNGFQSLPASLAKINYFSLYYALLVLFFL